MDNYPKVICNDCARVAGKIWPEGHIATFYAAICGVCGLEKTCTEPRDWGHFTEEELNKIRKNLGL